ncbi:HAT repeat-containing protein [Heterostelium album PN500]|uniref:HAT repeat-containing protein n=1 Tax=Heterostelium pallidum (strain ATCC 26659 / Pp 5 / PN500) TaxID=670386 RepID=D3B1F9_HETP5|nr:HAT repeat-containing protein [Heterostelium album PN500]EFA85133.1 HAT repeat-containing protein [Heterostelium album PN500]|eukprot:XP_020437242.1 HAT repeat-containing protein [Heterostelium album PN500]
MNTNSSKSVKVKNKSAAPVQITAEQILRVALENQQSLPKAPKQNITDLEELKEYRTRKRKEFEETLLRIKPVGLFIKYATWEESQKEFERARSVFERTLDLYYKDINVWLKYAEMEMRNKFINHARNVWDRAVTLLPRVPQLWFKYTFMEDMMGNTSGARAIFERWMSWKPDEQAWNSYIKFELRLTQPENARSIFERYVLCHPYTKTWIKYAKFEEKLGNIENTRSVFGRAVDFLGDEGVDETLFIAFAKFEEKFKEVERARQIYKYALDHIPKSKAASLFETFTNFEKQHGDRLGIEDVILGKRRFQYEEEIKSNPKNYDVWFDYTRLEESAGEVERAREVYERAIGNVPPSVEKRYWRRYIYLWINYALFEELVAQDADRARQVYQAVVKLIPHQQFSFSKLWIMYSHFEIRQMSLDRARQILGQAIGLAPKPKIFDAYTKLEIELGNFDRVRKLYENFAQFEQSIASYDLSRQIFAEANKELVNSDKEERILLLKQWKYFEQKHGTQEQLESVVKKEPKTVIKRKIIKAPDGSDAGLEEYYDYIFPEEQTAQPNLKLLEMAQKWKKQKMEQDQSK